jgi:hypothetical protein
LDLNDQRQEKRVRKKEWNGNSNNNLKEKENLKLRVFICEIISVLRRSEDVLTKNRSESSGRNLASVKFVFSNRFQ